ncbi:hypothetical protein BH09GEM1_BH09GEM1_12090 [soil metagenome]
MNMQRLAILGALLLVPAVAHAQTAGTTTGRRSWTSDRRDFVTGDIITVLVDEYTLASANKGQSGSDQQSRQNGLSVTPPAAIAVGFDASVGTNKASSSRQSGAASRDLRFRGEMTVRVVKVDSNGVLEVKGARTVDVDKNKQVLTLTGFVRPQDISHSNTIESSRVADAQILYSLTGELGGTRGGIIGRLVSIFWP